MEEKEKDITTGEKRPRRPMRVLMAIDVSPISDIVIKRSGQFARLTPCELTVLTVVENVIHQDSMPDDPLLRGKMKEAEEIVSRAAQTLESYGVECTTRCAVGPIDAEIVRFAEEGDFDCIFLGSRGLGGIKRMLLGSVADLVIRHAHCIVVVVR
jgi:nucleotide-binding universal stress UspA family protein